MAETIGALILTSIEAAGVTGATAAGSTAIVGTLTVNAVVGATVLTAASIGLSYALAKTPEVPKPEDGSQAIKQSIPPRIRGYWVNRLAGSYMLFEAAGGAPNTSYDVIAFHAGQIDLIYGIYLHDDWVDGSSNFNNYGALISINPTSNGYYNGAGANVWVVTHNGVTPQTADDHLYDDPLINDRWKSNFYGHGIAYLTVIAKAPSSAKDFTTIFPHQKPEASVVARCSLNYDPRNGLTQATPNPVIQLIDYLTGGPSGEENGGPGLDYETAILPVLDQWMIEANLCDELVDGESRYASAGTYQFDNKPEDVIGKILSTCDGYLSENGDGTLSLTVGVYREPTDPPITAAHITGWSTDYGVSDEEMVNQLQITITDPVYDYVSRQVGPINNDVSIADLGVHNQSLDLTWVQSGNQALRLGERAMLRLNPEMSGTLITTLYGLRYLGKRWIKVQYPIVAGLDDAVVEIQSSKIDLQAGEVSFGYKIVNPNALLALQ